MSAFQESAANVGVLALDPAVAVPPIAERRPRLAEVHGETRVDDYAWLRERADPEVSAYLEAENAYAEAVMQPTAELQQALYDEILGHVKQTDLSAPYRYGAYLYYSRTEEGKQYPIYARQRESLDAPEEITLDLNVLAEGYAYLGLGAFVVSDDGNFLAYSLDTNGYRQYTLYVKDLRSGEVLPDSRERVTSATWAKDGRTLFFVTENEVSKRSERFWRHELGSGAEPVLLYQEDDERYDLGVDRSRDQAYVFIAAYSKMTTEWRAISAGNPLEAPRLILAREEGHRYAVEHHDDSFYILTNRAAEDFRLVKAPQEAPGEENWLELVPEREGVHLDDLEIFEDFAVLRGRRGGFGNLEIFDFAAGSLRDVDMPETVHSVVPQPNPEFRTKTYRFAYQSLVTPNSVFELEVASGERTLLKQLEVPGFDPSLYASELAHATARDGTKIPISLVYRCDVARDGTAPLLLYGYGSYGISCDPSFQASRLVLLDRGVIYAIAHVRGGGELGERWRTSGHLMHKRNTFSDFIDCAEYLIARKYASPRRIAIAGGSAGGLLVAACVNMRPDLFAAVLAQVPFVDVVNTMLDPTLPLTTSEYLEWGDPRERAAYDYILSYSPYDNVAAAAYPSLLLKVSLYDSQVPYWEGAKLASKIRATSTGANPLLLVVNFGAGHGGASGRYDYLRELAFNYAFVLAELGVG
ncbi:MAG: S9 family peptidase [Vulcanimicrobiaceae bacterium]